MDEEYTKNLENVIKRNASAAEKYPVKFSHRGNLW